MSIYDRINYNEDQGVFYIYLDDFLFSKLDKELLKFPNNPGCFDNLSDYLSVYFHHQLISILQFLSKDTDFICIENRLSLKDEFSYELKLSKVKDC